jgi:hypothetical protein
MKRFYLILLAALLILPATMACRRDPLAYTDEIQDAELGLYIEAPGTPYTKAEIGDVPGNAGENALHSLKVWIFTSEGHELVYMLNLEPSQFPSAGRVRRYAIPVSRDFASTKPNLDIFALANGESVGCALAEEATWDQLNDAVFGENWFGVENPVRSINPSLGLPMSGVAKDVTPQGEELVLTIPTVRLKRAVAKLRYVFCRMQDEGMSSPDSIQIERITLNGSMIPKQEYLFTNNAYSFVPDDYEPSPIYTPGPSYIARNETPEKLVYANQDPASYEQLLDRAIEEGVLTDCGVMYLRESNKAISGEIRYIINQDTTARPFAMSAPGDFARNHTWTLYGYFLSGRNLMLSTRVLPWDYSTWTVNFSDQSVIAQQFSIDDTTVEIHETAHDQFDVRLIAGVTAKCHFYITAPVGGTVWIRPQGYTNAFTINKDAASINPNLNGGRVDLEITRNNDVVALEGQYMTLSFAVTIGDREMDANTELLNGKVYRFIP